MDASYNAKPAVVAVVGPTATGKTALGVALAQQFSGEVISADSMQIYKGLDVGTAKVTPQETCGIPHHGVDILTPEKTFSVADFTALAGEYIQDITGRGHLPLLVGGTGLYVQSLLYGVRFTAEKAPDGLREQLTAELEAIGPEAMYAKLQAVDPEAAAAIHPNNKVRVLRALEHYRATGKRLSEQKADSLPPERPYRSLVLGLDFPERAGPAGQPHSDHRPHHRLLCPGCQQRTAERRGCGHSGAESGAAQGLSGLRPRDAAGRLCGQAGGRL